MAKKSDTWMPQWVALPILDFARIVHQFGEDTESLGKWVQQVSEDLLFCNMDSEDELTRRLLIDAKEKSNKLSAAGKKGGRPTAKRRQQQNLGSGKPDAISTNDNGGDSSSSNAEDRESARESVYPARTTVSSDEFSSTDAPHGNAGDEPQSTASVPLDCVDGVASESATSVEPGDIDWHEAVCQALGTTDGNDRETEARQSQTGAGAAPLQNDSCHNAPAPRFPRKSRPPKNAEEVRNFAADHTLDVEDARDWYEMNYVERPGCDKDGVIIENWKGHCTAYCQTMAERRKAG